MTWDELVGLMRTARADLPIRVRLGDNIHEITGVSFDEETEALGTFDVSTKPPTPQFTHRVTAAVIQVE